MAATPDGSFNLKHRLVGATVLILIAVILLPRVLVETERDITGSSNILEEKAWPQIEPKIEAVIQPVTLGSTEVSGGTKIEIVDEVVAVEDEKDQNRSATFARDEESLSNPDQPSPLSLSQPSVDTVVKGYIAQVGVFREKKNLAKLREELESDGIRTKAELIEVDGEQAVRVWLGPFGTRSEALREGNKAMMRTNSKPMIIEWP